VAFVLRRNTGHRTGIPFHRRTGRRHLEGPLLPGGEEGYCQAARRPAYPSLIGGPDVGGEGIKERADFRPCASRRVQRSEDPGMDGKRVSPPIGASTKPIALAAQNALNLLNS